jgi:hypothetical protein
MKVVIMILRVDDVIAAKKSQGNSAKVSKMMDYD